jgi:hypothetical protein
MAVSYTKEPVVSYSEAEVDILNLLSSGRDNARSTTELVELRYGTDAPFHALSIVRTTIASLSRKADRNKESWRVVKSKRQGPHPISYWIEKRATDTKRGASKRSRNL